MEFCKKILDWTLLIAKIIFTIVLIIIGIRLIAFLLAPHFLISIPVFSFTTFDWNPLATIFGAVLTGLITWFAIYKTSQLDKKNRLYEFKYKHFIENLNNLNEDIIKMSRLTFCFERDEDCVIDHSLDDKFLHKQLDIKNFIKNYEYLVKTNSVFKNKTEGMKEIFNSFYNIYVYFNREILEHSYFLSNSKEEYRKSYISDLGKDNIIYCVDDFLKSYKDSTGIDYDAKLMNNALFELKNIIEEEFKLDEK